MSTPHCCRAAGKIQNNINIFVNNPMGRIFCGTNVMGNAIVYWKLLNTSPGNTLTPTSSSSLFSNASWWFHELFWNYAYARMTMAGPLRMTLWRTISRISWFYIATERIDCFDVRPWIRWSHARSAYLYSAWLIYMYWSRDKMADVFQKTFSNVLSWKKIDASPLNSNEVCS